MTTTSCYGMGASNVYAPAFQLLTTIRLTDNPICVCILIELACFSFRDMNCHEIVD